MRLRVRMQVGKPQNIYKFEPYGDLELETTNVSNDEFQTSRGLKGFQLSADAEYPAAVLDGSYKLFDAEKGYPGFLYRAQWLEKEQCFKVVSEKSSGLTKILYFKILYLKPVSHLFLIFDKAAGQYATRIEVVDALQGFIYSVENGSYVAVFSFTEPVTDLRLLVRGWNVDGGTIRFTYVGVSPELILEGGEIEDVECSEQAWSSSFKVSTGFMQQYADIVFRDHKKLLQSLSDGNLLSKFMPIDLSIEDEGVWEDLGAYISDTWSVDKTENKVTVSCNDYTRNFENYIIDLIAEYTTVAQLFSMISSQIPEVDIVPKAGSLVKDPLTGEEVSMSDYLNKCVARDVYFQGVEASRVIEELCDRWMLRLYWHPQLRKYVVMEAW